MDLAEAITKKKIISNKFRAYLDMNKREIEIAYDLRLQDSMISMSEHDFEAWVQVYASKILLRKKVAHHLALKLFVKDYLNAIQQIAKIDAAVCFRDF